MKNKIKLKNENKFNIKKENNEVILYYELRKLFIEKMKSTKISLKEFELLVMYSHILINIIFLKCRYEENTEKIIRKFINSY
jgi:hypothetical protein